jgi:hypothetical protein
MLRSIFLAFRTRYLLFLNRKKNFATMARTGEAKIMIIRVPIVLKKYVVPNPTWSKLSFKGGGRSFI